MLPEDILNKIMLFNSHPVADILKESSIFNYIKVLEILSGINKNDCPDIVALSFVNGCDDAHCGDEFIFNEFCTYYSSMVNESNIGNCLHLYTLGYMHTLEHENEDEIINNQYPYKIKVINDVSAEMNNIRAMTEDKVYFVYIPCLCYK